MKFADKVRECGAAYGMEIYTDQELLSLTIGVAPEFISGKSVQEILDFPVNIRGIGPKRELAIHAMKELAKRLVKEESKKIDVIHGPEDVCDFACPRYRMEHKEHFAVMSLNTKNHILALNDISIGSLNASIVHPREVFEEAILHHAAAIILIHNHPSGDPSPSREDIRVTQCLVKAGKIMDIPVLDHVILGSCGNYVSMKEKGLLE